MTIATIVLLSACSADGMENVSERRSGYFTAECDGYSMVAVSGEREVPFECDGSVAPLKPYTLITVTPKNVKEFDDVPTHTYAAKFTDREFDGTLLPHPFAASYSAEFDFEATENFSVTVKFDGKTLEFELVSSVSEDMLAFDGAIDVAATAVKPSGQYEVRARLIKNPIGEGLCWHVGFYFADGAESGALVDINSASIIAKK